MHLSANLGAQTWMGSTLAVISYKPNWVPAVSAKCRETGSWRQPPLKVDAQQSRVP